MTEHEYDFTPNEKMDATMLADIVFRKWVDGRPGASDRETETYRLVHQAAVKALADLWGDKNPAVEYGRPTSPTATRWRDVQREIVTAETRCRDGMVRPEES
jgi:hypothetical protein